ncbi:tetratricopeptide repeat protein [Thalassolituus sp. LLYu03]|uniref:tetratricopeptide repeat protein n=1 Tax=Thalassolituus sp. LLYu03 TaxID=3421656 RepID=UPI003D28FCB7
MINLEQALRDKRILVVDDLVEARSSIKKILVLLGAVQIDTATDGREAMQFLMERDYDIVFSDYNLGKGKDGQQILEEARYSDRLKATSLFILVTGENAVDMVMGALEYEPDNYITKPFTPNMLRERLNRIMAVKQEMTEIDLAIDLGDIDRAIALAEALLAKHNKRLIMPLTRLLGKLYIRQRKYDAALAIYSSLLNHRSVSWARLGQAICIHFLGDSRSALALLQQTLQAHPMYVQCYDWCAIILRSLGQHKEAQAQLEKAVSISPKAVLRQMELGRIAYENGDMPVAEEAFEQAMKLGRNSCYKTSANYLQFAQCARLLLKPGDSREQKLRADKAFKAIEELRQDYAGQDTVMFETSIVEGKTYVALNDSDNARASAKRAEELLKKMKNPAEQYQLQMAEAYIDTDQHVKAKQLIRHLRDRGMSDESLTRLQVMEDNLNKIAIREYTTEMNAKGVSYYEKGEYPQAVAAFDEAASYDEAGVSVLLNAIQAKISLIESTQVDVAQLKDCFRYFQRIGFIGTNDDRSERYERLKGSYSRLKRAAGL